MKISEKVIQMLFVLVTIVIFGCSQGYDTDVIAINNSSYDLNIVIPVMGSNLHSDITKGDSVIFNVYSSYRSALTGIQDPNEMVITISISDLKTGELITEINTRDTEENLFDFVGIENFTAMYRFVITDELLFGETQELKKEGL